MTESQKAADHYRKQKCSFVVFFFVIKYFGVLSDGLSSCFFFFFLSEKLSWQMPESHFQSVDSYPKKALAFSPHQLTVHLHISKVIQRRPSVCESALGTLQVHDLPCRAPGTRVSQLLSSLLVHSFAVILSAEPRAVPNFVGGRQGCI